MSTSNRYALRQWLRVLIAATIAFSAVYALLLATRADATVRADTGANTFSYLPVVFGAQDPVSGSYDCLEYEFGLVWTSDVITLYPDGSSAYQYFYGSSYASGTWRYTASLQEVGFTNFRWMSATFIPPDRMWNEQYLPGPGFEIAIDCTRRE
jgi:hypothetical protein